MMYDEQIYNLMFQDVVFLQLKHSSREIFSLSTVGTTLMKKWLPCWRAHQSRKIPGDQEVICIISKRLNKGNCALYGKLEIEKTLIINVKHQLLWSNTFNRMLMVEWTVCTGVYTHAQLKRQNYYFNL